MIEPLNFPPVPDKIMASHELLAIDLSRHVPAIIAGGVGLIAAAVVFIIVRVMIARSDRTEYDDANLEPAPVRDVESEEDDIYVRGSTTERRRALRRGGNPVAIWITDAATASEPMSGYVVDRSTGGLCVAVETPFKEGSILSVKATNAPQTSPWVQVEVRNCRRVGKDYELGCQFIKTPPWSVLLLFG